MKLKQLLILHVFALMSVWANSQVKGTVTSEEDGMPLPGVSIVVPGSTQGDATDFDGNYVLKNVVKLDNYFSPGQLEEKMKEFVQYYNYERYHESLKNVTPAEVYFGTAERKLRKRKMTKNSTLKARKKQYQNF